MLTGEVRLPTNIAMETWLSMSEQARAIGDTMRDPEAKKTMHRIAAGYLALVARAEERLAAEAVEADIGSC
jgi:hypothetical protein